jgi:hypothetical protein
MLLPYVHAFDDVRGEIICNCELDASRGGYGHEYIIVNHPVGLYVPCGSRPLVRLITREAVRCHKLLRASPFTKTIFLVLLIGRARLVTDPTLPHFRRT